VTRNAVVAADPETIAAEAGLARIAIVTEIDATRVPAQEITTNAEDEADLVPQNGEIGEIVRGTAVKRCPHHLPP